MTSYSDVLLSNSSLSPAGGRGAGSSPIVALVGATGGIGYATFEALLQHTPAPTIYLVGRSEARLQKQIEAGTALNASATIIPIVAADLTLVHDAQRAAQEIVAHKPPHLDLLVLSQGYFSFATRPNWTSEGLDKVTAIRYHSRLRFVVTLLPLLRAAPSPRVISVLAGGKEGALDLSDLGFQHKYGPIFAAGASASLTTLAFEELSAQPDNADIVFIHLYPGGVATGLKALEGPAVLRFLFNHTAKIFLRWFGYSATEAGERVLFAATNGRFRRLKPGVSAEGALIQLGSTGVGGSGVYLVQPNSSTVVGGKKLKALRDKGAGKAVLQYTLAEFERIGKL